MGPPFSFQVHNIIFGLISPPQCSILFPSQFHPKLPLFLTWYLALRPPLSCLGSCLIHPLYLVSSHITIISLVQALSASKLVIHYQSDASALLKDQSVNKGLCISQVKKQTQRVHLSCLMLQQSLFIVSQNPFFYYYLAIELVTCSSSCGLK